MYQNYHLGVYEWFLFHRKHQQITSFVRCFSIPRFLQWIMLLPSRCIPKLHFVSNEMSQTCIWLVLTILAPILHVYIIIPRFMGSIIQVSNVFVDCSWINKETKQQQQQQLVKVGVKCFPFLSYQYKTLIIYLIFEW